MKMYFAHKNAVIFEFIFNTYWGKTVNFYKLLL